MIDILHLCLFAGYLVLFSIPSLHRHINSQARTRIGLYACICVPVCMCVGGCVGGCVRLPSKYVIFLNLALINYLNIFRMIFNSYFKVFLDKEKQRILSGFKKMN
jgi:hypothetical protein